MNGQPRVHSLFNVDKALSQQPALLQVGQGDEALRYFAPAQRVSFAGEYLVYVAQSSLLLDLVRLKRSLMIQVDFGPQACFDAELSLTNLSAPSPTLCALALTLICSKPPMAPDSEQCCPIT